MQELSDLLLQQLATLEGSNKPFTKVFDFHIVTQKVGFPYLSFEPTSFTAVIGDTCNNERTYVYQILIFQKIPTDQIVDGEDIGRKEAKEIITKSIEDVITILDKEFTLNGSAIMLEPISGSITPMITDSGKSLVGEINVNIRVLDYIK